MEKEKIVFSEASLGVNLSTNRDGSRPLRAMHCHEAAEVVFADWGRLCVHIGAEEVGLNTGDVLLINSDVAHCIEAEKGAVFSYIQVEVRQYRERVKPARELLYSFCLKNTERAYYKCRADSEPGRIFCGIRSEAAQQREFYDRYIKGYIMLLIALMCREGMIYDVEREGPEMSESLLKLARLIDGGYRGRLTLDGLAARVGYSKFDLCRKFKEATGRTIVDYINYVRLYHAKKLLGKSDLSITEIALECGFSAAPYFTKVFKKYHGCSPGAYRKQRM